MPDAVVVPVRACRVGLPDVDNHIAAQERHAFVRGANVTAQADGHAIRMRSFARWTRWVGNARDRALGKRGWHSLGRKMERAFDVIRGRHTVGATATAGESHNKAALKGSAERASNAFKLEGLVATAMSAQPARLFNAR